MPRGWKFIIQQWEVFRIIIFAYQKYLLSVNSSVTMHKQVTGVDSKLIFHWLVNIKSLTIAICQLVTCYEYIHKIFHPQILRISCIAWLLVNLLLIGRQEEPPACKTGVCHVVSISNAIKTGTYDKRQIKYHKKPSYRWGTARRGRASWNLVKFCTNVDDLYLKSSETRLLPIRL